MSVSQTVLAVITSRPCRYLGLSWPLSQANLAVISGRPCCYLRPSLSLSQSVLAVILGRPCRYIKSSLPLSQAVLAAISGRLCRHLRLPLALSQAVLAAITGRWSSVTTDLRVFRYVTSRVQSFKHRSWERAWPAVSLHRCPTHCPRHHQAYIVVRLPRRTSHEEGATSD